MAERIATGSRPRVLENGPDTLNSDEEAEEDVEADKEVNMYTRGMDLLKGPRVLSRQEIARQHAAYQVLKAQSSASSQPTTTDSDMGNSIVSSRVSSPQPTRQSTPINSDDEDSGLTEDHKRLKAHARKCSLRNIPRPGSAPGTAPSPRKSQEGVGNSGTRSGDVPEPSPQASEPKKAPQPVPNAEERLRKERRDARDFLETLYDPRPVVRPSQTYKGESKAAAPPSASADQLKVAKAPPPTKGQVKGQESPGAKDTQPRMQTSSQASRAGGLRSGGGSGQTDTCVASGNPSKT
jgi:hypothetical protein